MTASLPHGGGRHQPHTRRLHTPPPTTQQRLPLCATRRPRVSGCVTRWGLRVVVVRLRALGRHTPPLTHTRTLHTHTGVPLTDAPPPPARHHARTNHFNRWRGAAHCSTARVPPYPWCHPGPGSQAVAQPEVAATQSYHEKDASWHGAALHARPATQPTPTSTCRRGRAPYTTYAASVMRGGRRHGWVQEGTPRLQRCGVDGQRRGRPQCRRCAGTSNTLISCRRRCHDSHYRCRNRRRELRIGGITVGRAATQRHQYLCGRRQGSSGCVVHAWRRYITTATATATSTASAGTDDAATRGAGSTARQRWRRQ